MKRAFFVKIIALLLAVLTAFAAFSACKTESPSSETSGESSYDDSLTTLGSSDETSLDISDEISDETSDEVTEFVTVDEVYPNGNPPGEFECEMNEDGDGIYIMSYIGNAATVVIPQRINNRPVIAIASNAFSNKTNITSITIPSTVSSLGAMAFMGCTSLKNIKVSLNNPYFLSADGVLFTRNGGELLAYPAGAVATSYEIPDMVWGLANGAFFMCPNLTSLTIPSSVLQIDTYAVCYCENLKTISVDRENTAYKANQNGLYTKDGGTLMVYPVGRSATSFEIPSTVTIINHAAFAGASSLKSIKIPSSVTYIGTGAFENCSALTTIEIPDSVTAIPAGAFNNCRSLESIVMPRAVTSIGYAAFAGCLKLKEIIIPISVEVIEAYAFYGCDVIKIKVEAASAPEGWVGNWNENVNHVIWGYTGNKDNSRNCEKFKKRDGATPI